MAIATALRGFNVDLRMFAPKSYHAKIFFKLAMQKGDDLLLPKR